MTFAAEPASDIGRVAGWYGKLPTVGDFASRRLEADFIEPWDRWLGDGLQAQRDTLGDAWLDAFLQSPAWRFVLAPGTLPGFDAATALAGVVMPSVDRVGRYFPLTLAGAIGALPASSAGFESVLAWIDRLENTALEALQGDWSIDDLEDGLASLHAPMHAAAGAGGDDPLAASRRAAADAVAAGGGPVDLVPSASRGDIASVLAAASGAAAPSRPALRSDLRGIGFWLADGRGTPTLLVSAGLPDADAFARMFGSGAGADTDLAAPAAPEPAADEFDTTRPIRTDALHAAMGTGAVAGGVGIAATAAGARPASASPLVDPLAMFDAGSEATILDPLAHAPPRDDILAMFGATGHEIPLDATPLPDGAEAAEPADEGSFDPAAREATAAPVATPAALQSAPPSAADRASHDELLALFDRAEGDAGTAAETDILGLFGGAAASPPEPGPGR